MTLLRGRGSARLTGGRPALLRRCRLCQTPVQDSTAKPARASSANQLRLS